MNLMSKVCVINISGNVGKSTLAAHMLAPRLGGAPIVSVESLNSDAGDEGVSVERVRGTRFVQLVDDVMERDRVVVDVGASNAEAFLKGMAQLDGAHEEFDYFVVPAVKSVKQLRDTANTVNALAALGVDGARIRLLFNRVDEVEDIPMDFALLLLKAQDEKTFVANPAAAVLDNEVYGRLKGAGASLSQIAADTTDWRARVTAAKTPTERAHATSMLALKRLSGSATRNLDQAFAALFS
jgi:Flp pilus assembly CpaE family ATPase